MTDLDPHQLLYVAGIALFLNILVFAATLVISWCKPHFQNPESDFEDQSQDHDSNVPLLGEYRKEIGSRLIDLIPKVKFLEVVRETNSSVGGGCCICLRDGFEDDELCKVLPECDHVFHSDCIDQWLKKNQSCPVCRKIFIVVDPQV